MAGPWQTGKPQQGYQLSLDPKSFFSAGAVAAQASCRTTRRARNSKYRPRIAMRFSIHYESDGKITGVHRTALHNGSMIYCTHFSNRLASPIQFYGGNRDKVFWRMVGYPGLPAFNTLNVKEFRGKPFPDAKQPQWIQTSVSEVGHGQGSPKANGGHDWRRLHVHSGRAAAYA